MSEASNIQTTKDMYAAFVRGDIAFIISQLTDDVHWLSRFDPIIPWAGDFSGKNRVPRFFEAITQSVDVKSFEPDEWIADGDTVVSCGGFACHVRATGKSAQTRWVFIWRFKQGKVASYEQFQDAALTAAFR